MSSDLKEEYKQQLLKSIWRRGNSKHKCTEDELNLAEIESLRLNLSDQKQMDNGQGT